MCNEYTREHTDAAREKADAWLGALNSQSLPLTYAVRI